MNDAESLRVDRYPIDDELRDDGSVGPELAHLARAYIDSPRALVFRNPSSDWRLFVVLLPLASRLSLMRNPIFTQLTRAWGLNLRFIGVDRERRVHDFHELLTDRMLASLVDWLGSLESAGGRADHGLDILFEALAGEMLTMLERAGPSRGAHLALAPRLEPGAPATLFERRTRYPDFLAQLRRALRDGIVDVAFYGRALRSIDLREAAVEQRIAAQILASLDPVTLAKLERTGAGQHLGAYNWLALAPRQAAMRAHVLSHLPAFATFFAEALVPIDLLRADAPDPGDDAGGDPSHEYREDPERPPERPGFDLKRMAARHDTAHAMHWHALLARAVDAGQDRAVIEAISGRFGISPNLVRRIWRERPVSLGQPPGWQLGEILRALESNPWPADSEQWEALIARAIPAAAL